MHPGEEVIDERLDVLRAECLARVRRRAPQYAIRSVDGANPQQALQPGRVAADRRLEEVAATVREAADEAHAVLAVLRLTMLEDVVDAALVRLQVAAEAAEQALHERAGMRLRVREQDRVAVDDGGKKCPFLHACGRPSLSFAGWISAPVASVEMTCAWASASCHIAWTIVVPSVLPACST